MVRAAVRLMVGVAVKPVVRVAVRAAEPPRETGVRPGARGVVTRSEGLYHSASMRWPGGGAGAYFCRLWITFDIIHTLTAWFDNQARRIIRWVPPARNGASTGRLFRWFRVRGGPGRSWSTG